ncbi:ATP-binding protein [Aliivibrio fischeri]|uniref:ATP-binding protein n=1 Tax=Aliivibrio fischeri TaxID=668 RepID=UPI00080DEE35|nr:ATP-binding protein [Aliivibrio fischeri]OCH07067.1 hypothetical protein A6E10_04765 [Aliivibrio fischeri]
MNQEKINANPTKDFFIEMLTRDIELDKSILDLIDNSIDAASIANVEEPKIEVFISEEGFRIKDNCGGLSKKIAQDYAFRFGRPKDRDLTPHSIGQFGVGMKRTLFKLGKQFSVKSYHEESTFSVNVNVNEWKNVSDWTFDISDINNEGYFGTDITVDDLYDDVSEQFKLESFIDGLAKEISRAHFSALQSGVIIELNGSKINHHVINFKASDEIGITQVVKTINGVEIKVTAGLSNRELHDAGWYIVCNGRLIEYAETTSKTTWKVDGIPQFHPDYAFFRGIVEFNSDDSSKLPWTTTKTGVDRSAKIYISALNEMKKVIRPYIVLLKERVKEDRDEKAGLLTEKPINDLINNMDSASLSDVGFIPELIIPDVAIRLSTPAIATIQYHVETEKLQKAKDALDVRTNKEVGEITFNYYFDYEC